MSNPRLSIIPAGAVTDRTLEPRDLQVLCLLGRHTDKAGWCVRSQVKMAQELDCSRGSLQNSLDRLSTAGWVEMKRRDLEVEQAGKQPSRSYAYRVLLDRDDYAFENAAKDTEGDDGESYAENASEEGGCQPVGTPVPNLEQHPGANACDGTPANTYVGTKNAPLERPHLERERDARARDKTAKFLISFEMRWPTAAGDDRQRTAYAAAELSEAEQEAALAGIGPFLENQKRIGRKHVPAGWRYLEEKRWTLLAQPEIAASRAGYPRDGREAKAIRTAYEVAGLTELFFKSVARGDRVFFYGAVNPRLLALADVPPKDDWPALNRQQAAAWQAFLRDIVGPAFRRVPAEGDRAPQPWPPKVDGTWSPTGPPPLGELSDEDAADFK